MAAAPPTRSGLAGALRRGLGALAGSAKPPSEARCKRRLSRQAEADLARFLASRTRWKWPAPQGAVDISAIVVAWNQPHFLLRCLTALQAAPRPATEIVLVDNGSAAPTQRLLTRLDGVTVVRNSANAGFVKACNQGVEASHGRVVLLLNSDAFVRPGALANGLAALDASPDIGALGGRLVLPSGRLQEAGCAIWSDATTTGHGRGLPPEAAEALPARDVDYCSGAFLMTPRGVWDRLGGLDETYSPGYYEDADYGLRLRQAGLRFAFEPGVVVDHYENGSQSRRGEALAISERNRLIFQARHAEVLQASPRRPEAPSR